MKRTLSFLLIVIGISCANREVPVATNPNPIPVFRDIDGKGGPHE